MAACQLRELHPVNLLYRCLEVGLQQIKHIKRLCLDMIRIVLPWSAFGNKKQNYYSSKMGGFTILALRLEMKRRVAWYTAWGLQCSGSVRNKISSQFCRLGMTLKAFGTLPAVKRLMILPTAW